MKLAILFALVATCTCWSWSGASSEAESAISPRPTSEQAKYQSGKEYLYKYESQVMHGIPTFSKQYAGVKVTCNVKFAFTSTTEAMLQLDSVRVLTVNKEIQDPAYLPPTVQVPEGEFTPLPSDQSGPAVEKLQKPIRFTLNNGVVENIEITDQEANWSLDIKRSILSLLQLHLKAPSNSITEKLPYNNLGQENVTTFDVLESGLDGNCYSSVHVTAIPHRPNYYKVCKSRDPSRCLKVNYFEKYSRSQDQANCDCTENINGKPCTCRPVNYYQNRPLPYTKHRTEYEVESRDEGQSWLITYATQNVDHRMESASAPNQFHLSTSNQTLRYVEEKQQHSVRDSGYSWKTISKPWTHQILSLDEEKHILTPQQTQTKVEELLTKIVECSEDETRFDQHYPLFLQLVMTLRYCSSSQLSNLFTEAKRAGSAHENKQWYAFVNALSYANTTNTDKFFLEKVMSKEIGSQEAAVIFAVWGADKVPTTPVLDYMMQTLLPSLSGDQDHQVVYRAAILSFGSMVRRYIHNEEIKMGQCMLTTDKTFHQRNIQNTRKYEKYIEGRMAASRTEKQQILHLNALSNVGSLESLKVLQAKISEKNPKSIRVQAIYAFRNLGYQNQLKTLQSLLPIMLNHYEDSELRMAAFTQVMKCDPSASLLEVQKNLNNEKDVEYKTFVVKYLKNMLCNKRPEYEQRSMRIRQVLKSVRAFHMSDNSNAYQMEFANSVMRKHTGDQITFSYLANKTSYYPSTGSYQHKIVREGRPHDFIEFGYHAEGFEDLLELVKDRASPNHQTSTSTTTPSSILSELQALKDMAKNYYKAATSKPKLTVYCKVMGEQVAVAHYDYSSLVSLVAQSGIDGKLEIPVSVFQTFLMTPQSFQRLHSAGFRMETSAYHMGVVDAQGTLYMDFSTGSPVVTFKTSKTLRFEFYSGIYQHVKMGFVDTELYNEYGTRSTYKAGERTYSYNTRNNELTVHNAASTQNDHWNYTIESRTATCVWPTQTPHIIYKSPQMHKYLPTNNTFRRNFTQQLTDMSSVMIDGKIEGSVHEPEFYSFVRDRVHYLPTIPSIHTQHITMFMRPSTSTPKEYTFKFGSQYLTSSQVKSQLRSQNQMTHQSHEQESSSSSQQEEESSEEGFLSWFYPWGNTDDSSSSSSSSSSDSSSSSESSSSEEDSHYDGKRDISSSEQVRHGHSSSHEQGGRGYAHSSSSEQSRRGHSSSESHQKKQRSRLFKPKSPGSIYHQYSFSVACTSPNQYLNMSANITTYYEHDYPQTRTLARFYRPAISGESEAYLLKAQIINNVNTNTNEVVQSTNMTFGACSNPKSWISMNTRYTPTYKDNQCYEQTAYGCKDQYGVVYPIWYNNTVSVTYENTEIPRIYRELLEPGFINAAESVYMSHNHANNANHQGPHKYQSGNEMNFTMIVRPDENNVDYIVYDNDFITNMSRIYAPTEVKLTEYFASRQYPVSSKIVGFSGMVPLHHRENPFSSKRDICVYEKPKIYSFEKKELLLPKTDCELLLAGDCEHQNKQLLVSAKYLKDQKPESVTVIIGENKVEIVSLHSVSRMDQAQIKVDGQLLTQQQLQGSHYMVMDKDGQKAGVLQFDSDRCKLYSAMYGVYVSVNQDRVKIEVDSHKTDSICGLCARNQTLPVHVSPETSTDIAKQYLIEGDQCTLEQSEAPVSIIGSRSRQCAKLQKHKYITTFLDNQMKTCITKSAEPICNRHCNQANKKQQLTDVRCVSESEARRLRIVPQMEGQEQIIKDERILLKLRDATSHKLNLSVADKCQ